MTAVAIGSVGGAPGVTTLVTAIAAASDDRALLVVEAPPDGGVLVSRWGWGRTAGMVDLAVRDSNEPADPWAAARPWIGSSWLLAADPSGVTMRQPQLLETLAATIGRSARPVLVDLGRLRPDPAALDLLRAAGRLWLLVDPVVEQVTTAAAWHDLLDRTCDVELLVSEAPITGAYPRREVAATLDWPLAATVPTDPAAANALAGRRPPKRGWTTAPLLRTAAALRDRLDGADATAAAPPFVAGGTAGSGARR